MRRYIVFLLLTGTVWAQTDFDKIFLIDGTEYLIDSNRVVYIHDVDNPSIIGRLDEHDDLILLSSDNR